MTSPYLLNPKTARSYEEIRDDLIRSACEAVELFREDELKQYAETQRRNRVTHGEWNEGSEK